MRNNQRPDAPSEHNQMVMCAGCGSRVIADGRRKTALCEKCSNKETLNSSSTVANESPANFRAVDQLAPDKNQIIGRLGRFLLVRLLGQGAFGRVYKAYDPQLERYVAIKCLQFSRDDTKKVQRFLVEAKAAAKLRHPNIVPTFESGVINDKYYICQQLIDGRTLSEEMKSNGDPRRIVRFIADSANALFYAHSHGIIHRDIKPQNIMVDSSGNPQIMDFGLAKRLDDVSELTTDGALLGTPSYMPPEQASGKTSEVNEASDQYSLGVILYETLAGRLPFQGRPHAVIHQVINDQPNAPSSMNPNVDQDLEAVCLKAMSKMNGERYSTCLDFNKDLENWLNGLPTRARPLGAVARIWRWCKRERKLAASISGIAFLLVAITIFSGFVAFWQTQAKKQIALEKSAAEKATQDAVRSASLAKRQTEIAKNALVEADKSKKIAEDNLRELQRQQALTARENERANTQTKIAKSASDAARESRIDAELATKEKELANYQKQLVDIYDAASSHPTVSQRMIVDCPEDWRGWEWYFLNACTRQSRIELPLEGEEVNSMQVSADGSLIVLGMQSGNVWVFDTQRKVFIFKEKLHSKAVIALTLSKDNSLIASSSLDKSLRVIERKPGAKYESIFQQQFKEVLGSLALSSYRKLATSPQSGFAQSDDRVLLWDIDTEKVIDRKVGRTIKSAVSSLAFDHAGLRLAIGFQDQTLMVWDYEKRKAISTSRRLNRLVKEILFEPRGKTLYLLTEEDNQLVEYEIETAQIRRQTLGLPRAEKLISYAYSPIRNESLALTSKAFILRQRMGWNVVHEMPAMFTADEGSLAAGGFGNELDRQKAVFFLASGFAFAQQESVNLVVYYHSEGPHPETNLIVNDDADSAVTAVGLDDGKVISIDGKGTVVKLNTVDRQFDVSSREPENFSHISSYFYNDSLPSINQSGRLDDVFSSDASGSSDLKSRIARLLPTQDKNRTVVVNANNQFGVSDTVAGGALIWLGKAREDASIFTTDSYGKVLVSASRAGFLQVWQLDRSSTVPDEVKLDFEINSIRVDVANESLLVGCRDGCTRRFGLRDFSLMQEYKGHYGSVIDAEFLPKFRRIASIGDDDTIRIWDFDSGIELLRIRHPTNGVNGIYSAHNERMIICPKQNGEFLCWDAGIEPAAQSDVRKGIAK